MVCASLQCVLLCYVVLCVVVVLVLVLVVVVVLNPGARRRLCCLIGILIFLKYILIYCDVAHA